MSFHIHQAALNRYLLAMGEKLEKVVGEAVEDARPHIHVDTGRLQKSFRHDKAKRNGNLITVNAIAGGVRLRGVVKEVDEEKDVDYALTEEIRHPQMRTFFIPAALRRIKGLSHAP